MNKLRSVFWDLDGTIADTEISGHRLAFNKAFNKHNLNWVWDIKNYKKLLKVSGGKKRIKYYAQINNIQLKEEHINMIHLDKQKYYQEIVKSGLIPLRYGVKRLFDKLQQENISQYLVTTSGIKAAETLLNHCIPNPNDLFSGYITYENVKNHKPDPEAYFKALSLSKSTFENTLVIEDSEIGLQAAKNANLKCLITISPWKDYEKDRYNAAESVVDSLGDSLKKTKLYEGRKLIKEYVCSDYLNLLLN